MLVGKLYFMPKSLCERRVRILAVLLGRLQISLVNLLNNLSNFLMFGLEKGTT